jgi:UTP:GlnB (protein PII) uridylyltransferase
MGDNVVDTFYVREADGSKVEREDRRDTLTAALLKAID